VNFRGDPEKVQRILPSGFRPKLYKDEAIAGICLIRLEHIRPKHTPEFFGLSSENAAHRIAVQWDEEGSVREGVFIRRRDTDSTLNAMAGGTLFPGEHNRADFVVRENDTGIDFSMKSRDEKIAINFRGTFAQALPDESIFDSLDDASDFFKGGSLGYSVTRGDKHLDGMKLDTKEWKVQPLAIDFVKSSFYDDTSVFPKGTMTLDHALIMQNVEHEWHAAPDYDLD